MAKSSRKAAAPKPPGAVSIQTVLCATDLSDCSQHALSQAAELAEAYDAKLVVVHVVELWDSRYDFLVSDLSRRLEQAANEQLERELAHWGKSEKVPVEVMVRKGSAAIEVLKAVKDAKADLVVVGSHGKGALDRILLGSVADKVLHAATTPLVLVRAQAGAK